MKRHNPPPTSITLRSNLTQRAAAEIAAARQRGESAGTLINSSASYEISALEFTVPGQQSVVSDGVVRTADQDTLRNAQERIDTAAGNVLSSASELLSEAQGALEILGSFSVSLKTESTGAMRASRVFTLKLS